MFMGGRGPLGWGGGPVDHLGGTVGDHKQTSGKARFMRNAGISTALLERRRCRDGKARCKTSERERERENSDYRLLGMVGSLQK